SYSGVPGRSMKWRSMEVSLICSTHRINAAIRPACTADDLDAPRPKAPTTRWNRLRRLRSGSRIPRARRTSPKRRPQSDKTAMSMVLPPSELCDLASDNHAEEDGNSRRNKDEPSACEFCKDVDVLRIHQQVEHEGNRDGQGQNQ